MKKLKVISLIMMTFLYTGSLFAYCSSCGIQVPIAWAKLEPMLTARAEQKQTKMKLSEEEVDNFVLFLQKLGQPTPNLLKLQFVLPKATIELLRGVALRGVKLAEAEQIAAYIEEFTEEHKLKNIAAFDENTSHIIGRDWHEIDYSGENMTWQKQQQKYHQYGITNFKTVENIKKFFPVEAKMPYFNKVYMSK